MAYEERDRSIPTSGTLFSSVSFEKMKDLRTVDYQPLSNGAINKLLDITSSKKIFPSAAREGAEFAAGELNAIIQQNTVTTVAALKDAVKTNMKNNNAKQESVETNKFLRI